MEDIRDFLPQVGAPDGYIELAEMLLRLSLPMTPDQRLGKWKHVRATCDEQITKVIVNQCDEASKSCKPPKRGYRPNTPYDPYSLLDTEPDDG